MKSEIKILVFKVEEMSKEGIQQWNKNLRHRIKRIVYVPLTHIQRLPVSVNTKDKLGDFMSEQFGAGTFVIRGWTKGYTKTKVKFTRLAKLKIDQVRGSDLEDKYKITFYDTSGISRYKFWRG